MAEKAKLMERGIPELGLIVTMNGFQAVGMVITTTKAHRIDSSCTPHPCGSGCIENTTQSTDTQHVDVHHHNESTPISWQA
jgi:hypothetical protein